MVKRKMKRTIALMIAVWVIISTIFAAAIKVGADTTFVQKNIDAKKKSR